MGLPRQNTVLTCHRRSAQDRPRSARPPQSSRRRDSSARSAARASQRHRFPRRRRSQYKENRDVSARPKTSSSRVQFLSCPSVARSPLAPAARTPPRKGRLAPPAPDTETPPGGGGRTGRSPPASKGPSGAIQRRFIGTLAKRAQVGKCGSVSQRSNVAQIVCPSCLLPAIAVRCAPESLAHAHCAV